MNTARSNLPRPTPLEAEADCVPLETERLALLRDYGVLDTSPELAVDELARLAATLFGMPIALVSLVDADRLWFKAEIGLGVREAPSPQAFCALAIRRPSEVLQIEDATRDSRFANNPAVTGPPFIRFYAGAPLVTPTGNALGTLCVIDRVPRRLDESGVAILQTLAHQVMAQLELRRGMLLLQDALLQQSREIAELNQRQQASELRSACLEQESCHDALTGLLNRRGFLLQISAELQRARRDGSPASLLIVDVDHFKHYNDAHGHLAGDEALCTVARLLAASCREYDVAARWGGEEFALVLPATDAAGAYALAERMRMAVQRHAWPLRPVTVSIGVATGCGEAPCDDTLLGTADAALYRSKREGRNRVTVADPDCQGRSASA